MYSTFNLRPLFILLLCSFAASCAHRPHFKVPAREPDKMLSMEVTGYCECGKCCNWKRSWLRLGTPVVASGPDKGKVKKVGQTASGRQAQVGTIAADTRYYPMGTVVYVPDYGWGRVEDRGGAIKGQKLDLFFNSHGDALHWGRKKRLVQVWYPRR